MSRPPVLEGETQREYAWRIYPTDTVVILDAHAAPTQRCRQEHCQAPIWWGLTAANKKRAPFDIKPDGSRTGTNHWRTCRDRPY
jgi:hypothetical protein